MAHHSLLIIFSVVVLLAAACGVLAGSAFSRDELDTKKLSQQYSADDDDAIWQSKKKKKKLTPDVDELGKLTEKDWLQFDDPELAEMYQGAPKGSDLEIILSNNLRMRREAFEDGKDLVGMDVSHLLGQAGGGTIKSLYAKFKPDVCPLEELDDHARRECAEFIQRKWQSLLVTGGITTTMPHLTEPYDKIAYFFQGSAIGNLPQMKAFLIDQPEVYSVTFDKTTTYAEGVVPPTEEEIAAESARIKEVNKRKRAAEARERLKERKKEQKKAKKEALERALRTGELRHRHRRRRLLRGGGDLSGGGSSDADGEVAPV